MKRAGFLLLAVCWLAAEVRAADWVRWRGPEQNGVALEKDLPDHWSPDPQTPNNNLIWKAPYGGRSTPIVMNGRVYLIDSSGAGITSQERILCFEENTGQVLWEKKFNVWHTDIDILRLGWTNLTGDPETGNLYVHGTQGLFMCLDRDGKVVWSHSLTEEYGRISGYGGRNSSPVVVGNLVILGFLNASWGEQAGPGNRWLAVNKLTGVPVWWSASPVRPKDTYASVPVVAVINGEQLLITGGGDGAIHALRVSTGQQVWSYMISTGGLSSSPVVDGNLVYICNDGGNYDTNLLGRVMCFDASQIQNGQPKVVWDKPGIEARYTSPLLHAGRLYVADTNARLHCFDGKTGKKLWTFKYGRNAKGSPVWADGKIYVGEVNSRFHILQPGDTNCKELDSVFFPSPTGDVEINGNAAVANGKVFFSTSVETYCIGKKDHQGEAGQAPAMAEETPADASRPTYLQVVPVDVALAPGESAEFKAQLFDEHGRFLRETQAKWSVAPMLLPPTIKASPPALKGEITPEGKLTVDPKVPGQFGSVVAIVEGLTGSARVRVAPQLPYKQDFAMVPAGAVPGGWVNTQAKFAVAERDGAKVLQKLANNASPLFARANAFLTLPNAWDYTIQADVLGTRKGNDMSDVGIGNCRYTLELNGNKQVLKIYSWESTPRPRVEHEMDFPWKPEVWYRMKFTVETRGENAVLRGKVWERDQQEPADWTIEFQDPVPNREGSPYLYSYVLGFLGDQPGAEVFFANVSVTPNKKEGTAQR